MRNGITWIMVAAAIIAFGLLAGVARRLADQERERWMGAEDTDAS